MNPWFYSQGIQKKKPSKIFQVQHQGRRRLKEEWIGSCEFIKHHEIISNIDMFHGFSGTSWTFAKILFNISNSQSIHENLKIFLNIVFRELRLKLKSFNKFLYVDRSVEAVVPGVSHSILQLHTEFC